MKHTTNASSRTGLLVTQSKTYIVHSISVSISAKSSRRSSLKKPPILSVRLLAAVYTCSLVYYYKTATSADYNRLSHQ